MTTDRRGFLRLTTGAALGLLGASAQGTDLPPETALGIHHATRNTRLGAVGVRVRALRSALRPWKPYPGRPRTQLPAPDWTRAHPLLGAPAEAKGDPEVPLGQDDLSRLLYLANGITQRGPGRPLRAAPSAGALYAGELYVLTSRVSDLAAGIWYYGVRGHALIPVRRDVALEDLGAALERPGDASGAAALVLVTNVFARYRVRYANRGYRYALIDTGHIGENLRLAAAELGLACRALPRWEDDRLNDLLAVDGREEAVCAVYAVGRRLAGSSASGRSLGEGGPEQARARGGGPTERYHEATKLVPTAVATSAARSPRTTPPEAVISEEDVPETTTHEAIRIRRSARRFTSEAMSLAVLQRVLAFAHAGTGAVPSPWLELHVVAHRIAGLAPGAFLFSARGAKLTPHHTGPLADALVDACLGQSKSGEAAAAVIGVAHIAEAAEREGARSYRDVLIDAGAAAQRLYLAAEAHGLAARNLAAYYDDDLDALLGLDGRRRSAVHLTALGPGD